MELSIIMQSLFSDSCNLHRLFPVLRTKSKLGRDGYAPFIQCTTNKVRFNLIEENISENVRFTTILIIIKCPGDGKWKP